MRRKNASIMLFSLLFFFCLFSWSHLYWIILISLYKMFMSYMHLISSRVLLQLFFVFKITMLTWLTDSWNRQITLQITLQVRYILFSDAYLLYSPSSSKEPLEQFQPNLAQSILGWRGPKFLFFKWRALSFFKWR